MESEKKTNYPSQYRVVVSLEPRHTNGQLYTRGSLGKYGNAARTEMRVVFKPSALEV